MERGDHQGQGHPQGQGQGQVQTGFDTFVMTGDMIIKTTPKLPALSTRPKPKKLPTDAVQIDHASTNELSPDVQQASVNGGMVTAQLEVAGYMRLPDVPVELEIPPDDISSEDERYRIDNLEDLDVSNLPPPPAEFLGDFSDTSLPSGTVVVEDGLPAWQASGLPGCDQSGDWRNSLDEAIMRLECHTAAPETRIGNEVPSRHGPVDHTGLSMVVLSAGRGNVSGSLVSAGAGVRASKSQDNWLHCGDSGVGFVNIDVDGPSASVEALHCLLPTTSLDSLDSTLLLQYKSTETPLLHQSADDVWHRDTGTSFNSKPTSAVEVKNTVDKSIKDDTDSIGAHSRTELSACYNENSAPEHPVFGRVEDSRNSSGQRLLGGGKSSPVRRPPPFQNGTDSSVELNHHIPASRNNVADASRPQLKDADHPSACRLAKRLYHLEGFCKSDVSKHLSKKNDFAYLVGAEYIRYFDLSGLTLDMALREFLRKLVLAGETQERERILAHFSRRYLECNPGSFNSEDACHTLVCAVMLLNTDLHSQGAGGKKMTLNEFVENLVELNDGDNFPYNMLTSLYHSIRREPLEFEVEDDGDVNDDNSAAGTLQDQAVPSSLGSNPFLDVPDPNMTTEYKKGYVMRKCCTDPDGRKTAVGRRGWRMFYVTLCDMVLYLHKDERSFKQSSVFGTPSNAARIHHALATRATDYIKKQHVFRLQMADWSQSLFQASSSEECQSWISTINYVAATLSAPPLPGAVGSQKKFQRPLMPCSYTKLSLKDQLKHHECYLSQIDSDLAEHTRHPPERGAKARVIQDYVEKETYLQFEQERFRTYCTLLHMRLCMPPSSTSVVGAVTRSMSSVSAEERTRDSELRTSRQRSSSSSTAMDTKRTAADRRRLKHPVNNVVAESVVLPRKSVVSMSPAGESPSSSSGVRSYYSPCYYNLQSARSMPMMMYETRV